MKRDYYECDHCKKEIEVTREHATVRIWVDGAHRHVDLAPNELGDNYHVHASCIAPFVTKFLDDGFVEAKKSIHGVGK